MKNKILYISLIIFSLCFYSCNEEVEIWDSNTLSYAGTYDIEILAEDGTTVEASIDEGEQLMLFNTAANIENEIWIQDLYHWFPLMSKFKFTGNSTSFESVSTNFDDLTNNQDAIESPDTDPTAAGEVLTEDRYYLRSYITEGKIGLNDAETTGGNISDSIRFKIVFLSGSATFTSYQTEEATWVSPGTPEFAWKLTSTTYDNTLDETYIVSGYRYTGFEEDLH